MKRIGTSVFRSDDIGAKVPAPKTDDCSSDGEQVEIEKLLHIFGPLRAASKFS